MACYITHTGAWLPGFPVANSEIERHLGVLPGESTIRDSVLSMNGIRSRYYAQDEHQQATQDVYQMAALAAETCCLGSDCSSRISFLSAGTTYAPLAAPGIASIVHHRLQQHGLLTRPVEISSHAGICTSAAAAMVNGIRAVNSGEHRAAFCIGAEHASEVLKANVIQPVDDRALHTDVRQSQWFMAVFLRFMLSDGAGACIVQSQPNSSGLSLRVDWTHSMSFANETPLCMKLENRTGLLTQDVTILSRYLVPMGRRFLADALTSHQEEFDSYTIVLPHMSSFFFRKRFEQVLKLNSRDPDNPVPYWTNLESKGNTGAASIYVMLNEYVRQHTLRDRDRILLFIPESGQFNFVMVSLTVVLR